MPGSFVEDFCPKVILCERAHARLLQGLGGPRHTGASPLMVQQLSSPRRGAQRVRMPRITDGIFGIFSESTIRPTIRHSRILVGFARGSCTDETFARSVIALYSVIAAQSCIKFMPSRPTLDFTEVSASCCFFARGERPTWSADEYQP